MVSRLRLRKSVVSCKPGYKFLEVRHRSDRHELRLSSLCAVRTDRATREVIGRSIAREGSERTIQGIGSELRKMLGRMSRAFLCADKNRRGFGRHNPDSKVMDALPKDERVVRATRCQLIQRILCVVLALGIPLLAAAPNGPQTKDGAASQTKRRIFIDGKQVPSNRILVRDGVDYVDVGAFVEAIGGQMASAEGGVLVTSGVPKSECEKPSVEGRRFSEQFRSKVSGVPDEIESVRAVMMKKENVPLGPRFDTIDQKLNGMSSLVQTDADQEVYYALAFANTKLAIAYYKVGRGVAVEETQKDQLDSMMCSMESKFALMKGLLVPGGSCDVFKRMGSPSPPTKTAQKPPDE